jgi:hypothetical protein
VVYPEFANIVKGGKHRLCYKKMIPEAESRRQRAESRKADCREAEGGKQRSRRQRGRRQCIYHSAMVYGGAL